MAKTRIPKNPVDAATASIDAASATPASTETNGNGSPTRKAVRVKSSAKPELVKTESRTNLVPINIEDEIRALAYLMSERRGFAPGHESEDWFAAEHEVLQRYHQHSA